jgi:hypothetical protein
MARPNPRFDYLVYNDAALANGVRVPDIFTMPYDGYIVGLFLRGAGVEGADFDFSDGSEIQEIPGRDIAVDSDVNGLHPSDGPGKAMGLGFTVLNQPCQKNTRISYTPRCTGTAESNCYMVISPQPTGPYTITKHESLDLDGLAAKAVLTRCPTQVGNNSNPRLKRFFGRGQGCENLEMQLGGGGVVIFVPMRAIAIYTDACVHSWLPIDVPAPDEVLFVSENGNTTTNGELYFQYE